MSMVSVPCTLDFQPGSLPIYDIAVYISHWYHNSPDSYLGSISFRPIRPRLHFGYRCALASMFGHHAALPLLVLFVVGRIQLLLSLPGRSLLETVDVMESKKKFLDMAQVSMSALFMEINFN